MPTTRVRSGTTPSPRMKNPTRRPATTLLLGDGWPHLPRIAKPQRGGPAGAGMEAPVQPQIPPTTLPGPRGLGKAGAWPALLAEAEVEEEMGASGMPHIPQRHHICTDRCSHANLRRRRGLPPAEPQVRKGMGMHTHNTLTHTNTYTHIFHSYLYVSLSIYLLCLSTALPFPCLSRCFPPFFRIRLQDIFFLSRWLSLADFCGCVHTFSIITLNCF